MLSRRVRHWNMRSKENRTKTASHNDRKVKNRTPVAPPVEPVKTEKDNGENVAIILPNGMNINASGQWAILIIGLSGVAMLFCQNATKVLMCICARLNRNPTGGRAR